MPLVATWMQLEIIMPNEVSEKEKYKYHMISLICGIWLMTQMNLTMKQKQSREQREQTCAHRGGGAWTRMEWGTRVSGVDEQGPTAEHRELYSVSLRAFKKSAYIYTHLVNLLYTWNYHNIVNQLNFNIK